MVEDELFMEAYGDGSCGLDTHGIWNMAMAMHVGHAGASAPR